MQVFYSVPGAGIEPARVLPQRFLRPSRLPIPPPGPIFQKKANYQTILFISNLRKLLMISCLLKSFAKIRPFFKLTNFFFIFFIFFLSIQKKGVFLQIEN